MNKIMIEMEDEQVDAIVVQELKNALDGFERSIEERSNGEGLAFFDHDPAVDVMYIQKYIDAFRLAVDYYGN
jgi:hypothetical protein